MKQGARSIARLGWLLPLTVAVGCSSGEPCSVSGQASYLQKPIEQGAIRFFPLGDTPGAGAGLKIIGGRYEVPVDAGLVAGEYMVSVSGTRSTGRMVAGERVEGAAAEVAEAVQYIPETYNARSTLRVVLSPGENQYDVHLPP